MQNVTKTRSQRRLEKKQAVFLLVLLLVVSLGSFVLGIMVGRRGAERDYVAQLKDRQEAVRVVQVPAARVAPEADPVVPASVVEPSVEDVAEPPRLSFYEDLAHDAAPLGSGINQQPRKVEPPAAVAPPPLDLPEQPIVVREPAPQKAPVVAQAERTTPSDPVASSAAVAAAAATGAGTLPQVSAQGSHAVQIGSFAAVKDAAALRQGMIDKGYTVFLVEANLGDRGLWYRVRVGPYANSDEAAVVQKILAEKEKIEGFVTRHQP